MRDSRRPSPLRVDPVGQSVHLEEDHQGRRHQVEHLVLEGRLLCIPHADDDLQSGVCRFLGRRRDHARREIDADRPTLRADRSCQLEQCRPAPSADIQCALAGAGASSATSRSAMGWKSSTPVRS
jgi:hypothetical protein